MIKDQERRLTDKVEKNYYNKQVTNPDREWIVAHLQMMASQLEHLANKIF